MTTRDKEALVVALCRALWAVWSGTQTPKRPQRQSGRRAAARSR